MKYTWLGLGRQLLLLAALGISPFAAAQEKCDGARIAGAGFAPQPLCALLATAAREQANTHAVVILRHGAVVAERYYAGKDRSIYWPFARSVQFDAAARHDVRSISKSVTSLLWGIAQGQGTTPALDTPVLALYPHDATLKQPGHAAITLEHLLTMSSGLAWHEPTRYDASNDETGLHWRSSQLRYLVDRPMSAAAGTRFNYNGGGTAVIAHILEQRVGMPLPDYARRQLFAPLGITDWEWTSDLRGRPLAFAGLRLRPRDLATIGQLVLQRGAWQGRQIVPAAWVDASTQPHIATGDGLAYGYQWWMGEAPAAGKRQRWVAGFGNGGQRLFIVPGLDMVVAITAGAYDDAQGGRRANALFRAILATVSPAP